MVEDEALHKCRLLLFEDPVRIPNYSEVPKPPHTQLFGGARPPPPPPRPGQKPLPEPPPPITPPRKPPPPPIAPPRTPKGRPANG